MPGCLGHYQILGFVGLRMLFGIILSGSDRFPCHWVHIIYVCNMGIIHGIIVILDAFCVDDACMHIHVRL